jgi:hypothetical protein
LVPLFVTLTVLLTWPMAHLWDPQLPAHDDAMFSVWRLAWVAHQLTTDPVRLFDANIFWPQQNTLAYSDAMLLLGVAGAPLIWLGVHPVVVHNLLLLAAFVSAGVGAAHLMRYFTPSVPAQLVAGIVFAFAPYRVAHLGHLELLWTAFLPLSLLGVYKVLERPTVWRGLGLGLAVGLQALCSVYYAVFLIVWLVPAALLALWHVRVQWSSRHLVAPYAAPYARARVDLPPRADAEVRRYSATPVDYLRVTDSNRLYPALRGEAPDERSLFVGTIALMLAAAGVVLVRTRAAVALLVLTFVAADLSLGLNGISYPLLRDAIPPLGGLRAPARFGVLVLLAVAVLAGLGLARLLSRATMRQRQLVTAALVVGLTIEYWSGPIGTRHPQTAPPPVYAWLAGEPPSVVLELPVPTPDGLWLYETSHQYFSIYHWQRLVNGYSGHAPASYVRLLESLRGFPSDESIARLRERQVDLVIFHRQYLDPDQVSRLLAACANPSWFSEVVQFPSPEAWGSTACRVARPN